MSQPNSNEKILLVSPAEILNGFQSQYFPECDVIVIKDSTDLEEKMDKLPLEELGVILCDGGMPLKVALEMAQVFTSMCPEVPLYVLTNERMNLQAKSLKKNGFDEVFLLPADEKLAVEKISDHMSADSIESRRYKPVKIIDLHAGSELEFDVYAFLPLNGKYIKYLAQNKKVSQGKLDKLMASHHGTVYIHRGAADRFYEYSAQTLMAIGQSQTLSATEREEKLADSVRTIFFEMFDNTESSFDSGKSLLETCNKIVSTYISGRSSGVDFQGDLLRAVGGMQDIYRRSSSVSTVASMLAIGIGSHFVSDVSIAAFLCDLSLADFPSEMLDLKLEEMDGVHQNLYRNHPRRTLNLIKEKKMVISKEVEKAILQHHERFDGRGFPDGKSGDFICEEAQLIALAETLVDSLFPEEGKERMTPVSALNQAAQSSAFCPDFLRRIGRILKGSEEAA